jgi:molybdopterin molybdotransferase
MLQALALTAGVTCAILPTAPDEAGPLRAILARGLAADVLLISGGVSAGTHDLVPAALAELGVQNVFHKVRLKPGKPLWFGVGSASGVVSAPLVFGLPGNPVSGLVGYQLFVRPSLDRLMGLPASTDASRSYRLSRPYVHAGDRPTYFPSRLVGVDPPLVEPLDWAGSADLRTVASADGFAVFPAGDRQYEAGEVVRFVALR